MAGTFTDQATLAKDAAFIDKCRAAMIFRAVQLVARPTSQSDATLAAMSAIIQGAGSNAPNMAWLIATGNATVAASAPAVPSDGDTQFAVNSFLPGS